MDGEEVIEASERFTRDVFRFEKKKLILPSIAVLVLLGGFFAGDHLRSEGVDSRLADTSTEFAFERQFQYRQEELFNITFNESRDEEVTDQLERTDPMQRPERYEPYHLMMAEYAALGAVYRSPFYPVAPGHAHKSVIFTPEKGYYLSDEIPHGAALWAYRGEAMEDLHEEADASDMSVEEFRAEAEQIRSRDMDSPELEQQLRDMEPLEGTARIAGSFGPEDPQMLIEHTLDNQVEEVGLVHLIPAVFAAFVWNYLISGVILTGLRDFRKDIDRFSERDHFFRNNLLLSAAASTVVALTLQLALNPDNFLLIIAGTAASSLLWLGLFAAVTNEARKYTRYAWILTGIGLNLLILPLDGMLGYSSEFILNTFITGATPLYPLMLGAFSEYGRIHGEKHLRKKLEDR